MNDIIDTDEPITLIEPKQELYAKDANDECFSRIMFFALIKNRKWVNCIEREDTSELLILPVTFDGGCLYPQDETHDRVFYEVVFFNGKKKLKPLDTWLPLDSLLPNGRLIES